MAILIPFINAELYRYCQYQLLFELLIWILNYNTIVACMQVLDIIVLTVIITIIKIILDTSSH